MHPKRVLIIINPISGVGSKEGLPEFVEQALSPLGWEVRTCFTSAHGDASRLAAEAAAAGCHAVIAAGGDGTVNETAAALCGSDTALGIIPCGSGNGLARHLGIPIDVEMSLQVILRDEWLACDFATVNDMPFFCTFGVGFDAEVSHRFAKQRRRGKLSYIRSAIAEYIQFRPQLYTIRTDDRVLTERAFLVAVCNASQYGNNAYIAPHASISDGLLDVTVIHAGTPIETMIAGADIMTGLIDNNASIDMFRARRITIERAADGPAHIDGEPIHVDNVMKIECHPQALRVFTPPEGDSRRFYPLLTPMADAARDFALTLKHLFPKGAHSIRK